MDVRKIGKELCRSVSVSVIRKCGRFVWYVILLLRTEDREREGKLMVQTNWTIIGLIGRGVIHQFNSILLPLFVWFHYGE